MKGSTYWGRGRGAKVSDIAVGVDKFTVRPSGGGGGKISLFNILLLEGERTNVLHGMRTTRVPLYQKIRLAWINQSINQSKLYLH